MIQIEKQKYSLWWVLPFIKKGYLRKDCPKGYQGDENKLISTNMTRDDEDYGYSLNIVHMMCVMSSSEWILDGMVCTILWHGI